MRVAAPILVAGAAVAVTLGACGGSDPVTTTVTAGATGASGPTGPAPIAEEDRPDPEPPGPVEVVKDYYSLVDALNFQGAWQVLPTAVQVESGGFDQWREGYDATVSTDATNVAVASQSGNQAVVSLDVQATDVDACTGNDVDQTFSGTWSLQKTDGKWTAQDLDIAKVSGGAPTLSASECPASPAPSADNGGGQGFSGSGCEPGYDPCVPAYPPDVDCADVGGPVSVNGSDPHYLDADSDGIGCET